MGWKWLKRQNEGNDGKRDWEDRWEDGSQRVREQRERADRAAAGTLWDYKAEKRKAEDLGGAVKQTLCFFFPSVEGLLLHPFGLHC